MSASIARIRDRHFGRSGVPVSDRVGRRSRRQRPPCVWTLSVGSGSLTMRLTNLSPLLAAHGKHSP